MHNATVQPIAIPNRTSRNASSNGRTTHLSVRSYGDYIEGDIEVEHKMQAIFFQSAICDFLTDLVYGWLYKRNKSPRRCKQGKTWIYKKQVSLHRRGTGTLKKHIHAASQNNGTPRQPNPFRLPLAVTFHELLVLKQSNFTCMKNG